MAWPVNGPVGLDLSFLLDAPAGRHGFVRIDRGHLVRGDGQRLRLWGVNFSFVASLPAKEDAPAVAAYLARFGVNSIRVHHLDWRVPRGIIDSRFPDSRHLDPEKLDRLDFFIAALKKRGIYTNLNLNVARAFQEADGVKDAGQVGYAKALTIFDPRMIELQQEYARALLAHRNPYTGAEYRHEPAIAIVELINENSLVESWARDRLLGKGLTKLADKTWTDIPASYERDLTALWRDYLRRNLKPADLEALRREAGDPVPRLGSAGFKTASKLRFHTEAAFYMDLEDRFFQRMAAFLKKDLGVKAPITGTSVHNGGLTPYPLLASTSKLDIVDAHTYWQHPRYLYDPAGKRTGFEIPNTPMVNDPARSTLWTLGRAAVAGKPFMVSEINHPYPNEYAAEGMPLAAAFAAFQDWDAVYWYSFEHGEAANWKATLPSHFDIRQEPVKMSQLAASALLFLRGDVAPARRTLNRGYTRDEVIESLRMPSTHAPIFDPGYPFTAAIQHAVRVSLLTSKPRTPPPALATFPVRSDTGEIEWSLSNGKRGLVAINAPRAQALVGYIGSKAPALDHLSADLENEFAAIVLTSLDGKPISNSSRMLLTAGARVAATGMRWNEKRTQVLDPGKPPVQVEAVEGAITLSDLQAAKSVVLIPLDGAGRKLSAPIPSTPSGGGWTCKIGEPAAPWYLVSVAR
jgi:hypothetical protein